jgi:hypothetical protein
VTTGRDARRTLAVNHPCLFWEDGIMPPTAAPGDLCAGIDHAKLRAWREAAGLTREQVSACAGIGYPLLCAIELGNRRPRLAMLTRLAMLYGRDPADLLTSADGTR